MPLFPQGGGLYPNSIDNVLLEDMPDGTFKGRPAGSGLGDPQNIPISQLLVASGITAFGQCRLDFESASVLRLNRCNGYLLTIDNVPQVIPVPGPTLAPTGTTVGQCYYVYAAMVGGAMTLEAANSSTAYAVDPRNGIKIKSGDPTRTLVGSFYSNTGPAFAQSSNLWGVSSYFNRRTVTDAMSVNTSTASTSPTGLANAIWHMSWADDAVIMTSAGYSYGTVATAISSTAGYYQRVPGGSMNAFTPGSYTWVGNTVNTGGPVAAMGSLGGVDGQLTGIQPFGFTNAGTSTWSCNMWVTFKI